MCLDLAMFMQKVSRTFKNLVRKSKDLRLRERTEIK